MCGIFASVTPSLHDEQYKTDEVLSKLKHRGPDLTGEKIIKIENYDLTLKLLHTRLAINGDSSPQPIINDEGTLFLVVNGEIFNWHELQQELHVKCTKSDCEIILHLYEKYKNNIPEMLNKINGQFSFVLYDTVLNKLLVARDQIGITPLYMSTSSDKFIISSEMKCLTNCENVSIFPPRNFMYSTFFDLFDAEKQIQNALLHKYTTFDKFLYNQTQTYYQVSGQLYNFHKRMINNLLNDSVKLQLRDLLQNDAPDFGVLLSGGLDSSLIASLVVHEAKRLNYTKPIKTFSIGIHSDVPDLKAARKVSEFLGTEHTEYTFSIKQGLDALTDVIWYTETYDCTSVRASTPMYLLTRKIHQQFPKLKVLFSGELSDELFCYLYGANAPDLVSFQNETVDLVTNVHHFDCLRANKTCMANSIEVRVPFTDPHFVKYVLSISPVFKIFGKNGRMEKELLRKSFIGYLPDEILYRKKEQFSDGVSGFNGAEDNWIDALKKHTDTFYTDARFSELSKKYKVNQPTTKEQLYFRELFSSIFNEYKYDKTVHETVKIWKPKWCESDDPSGRIQSFWSDN